MCELFFHYSLQAVLGQPVLPVLTNSSLLGTGRETVAKPSQLEGYVDVLSSVSFCSKIDLKVEPSLLGSACIISSESLRVGFGVCKEHTNRGW